MKNLATYMPITEVKVLPNGKEIKHCRDCVNNIKKFNSSKDNDYNYICALTGSYIIVGSFILKNCVLPNK